MSSYDEDEELARLEAELAALRGGQAAPTPSNFPPSYESSSSYSTTGASSSSVPISSASQTLLQQQQKEMEELKRQLADAQSKPRGPPSVSASQTLLEQQRKEMEELKRQLAEAQSKPAASSVSSASRAPSASQTLLEQQRRETEELKNQLALAEQQREMDALRRQLAASQGKPASPSSASVSASSSSYSAASSPSSETQRRLDQQKAENEALKAKLAAMKASPPPSASTTKSATASTKSAVPDTLTKEMAEQQRRLEEIERKKKEFENAAPSLPTDVFRNAEKEKELKELQRKLNSGATMATLEAQRTAARSEYEKKAYGVDVCFVMDCTGSMSPWINAAREKIFELAREIPNIKSSKTPHMRIGFVGYRDHDHRDDLHFVKIDFFDLNDQVAISNFQTSLKSIAPMAGTDFPEDLVGGMDQALNNMKWNASTKLIILFGDAPCHGTKYHTCGDNHPDGDPHGRTPEGLLDDFISKSVHFYFGEISPRYTKQMTDIFAAHMSSRNKANMFTVIPMSAGASLFLPAVVQSITSTMAKSGIFGLTT